MYKSLPIYCCILWNWLFCRTRERKGLEEGFGPLRNFSNVGPEYVLLTLEFAFDSIMAVCMRVSLFRQLLVC